MTEKYIRGQHVWVRGVVRATDPGVTVTVRLGTDKYDVYVDGDGDDIIVDSPHAWENAGAILALHARVEIDECGSTDAIVTTSLGDVLIPWVIARELGKLAP